jgi:carbamoyl-phosphate synthase large subunit
VEVVNKITEGRPHIVDLMKNREIQLVINTPLGARAASDSAYIRRASVQYRIPYFTTVEAARMAARAIESLHRHPPDVLSLQEWYELQKRREPACTRAGGPN